MNLVGDSPAQHDICKYHCHLLPRRRNCRVFLNVWYRPVGDKCVGIVSQNHFKNPTQQFEHKHLELGATPLVRHITDPSLFWQERRKLLGLTDHLEVISGIQLSGILYIPLCLIRF